MREALVGVAALALSACLVGCEPQGAVDEASVDGPSAEALPEPKAEYASPKVTFETLWAAAKAGDENAMMACFCEEAQAKFAEIGKLYDELAELAEVKPKAPHRWKSKLAHMIDEAKTARIEPGQADIQGKRATLDVFTDSKLRRATFVREEDGWKLDLRFGGYTEAIYQEHKEELKKKIEQAKKAQAGKAASPPKPEG